MTLKRLKFCKAVALWLFAAVFAATWQANVYGKTPVNDASVVQPTPLPEKEKLDHPALRFALLEYYVDSVVCGPPVARMPDEAVEAAKFALIQKDSMPYELLLKRLKLKRESELSREQKSKINLEYAKLRNIRLQPMGEIFQFFLLGIDRHSPVSGKTMFYFEGEIDPQGKITEIKRRPVLSNPCPVCLAGDALIDTPNGAIAVKDLKPGDVIWTRDVKGGRIATPIIRSSKVPVSRDHRMVHLVMSNGRELWVSPGHPTIQGTLVGSLERDEIYDGATVVRADLVPYGSNFTYDILPAGETGFYWANGILLGSTLK